MKTIATLICGLMVLVMGILPVHAQERSAKSVIDDAIKAMGGKAKLSKYKAISFTDKGTFYGLGNPIEYTGKWKVQPPVQIRFDMEMTFMDMKITILEVVNKNKGFKKINDNLAKLSDEEVKEKRQQLWVDYVSMLVPVVSEPGFNLSRIGDVKIKEKPAEGILISKKGQRDVQFFFDKKTHWMVKAEYEVNDPMMGGKQTQTVFYGNYKKFNGILQPTSLTILRDGKRFVVTELSNIQFLESFEDKAFEE